MRTLRILLVAAACIGRLTAANALHLGFMEGGSGSVIEIPVYRTGGDPVAGANFDFRFDPARMEFIEALSGTAAGGWTLDSEQTVANEVRLLLTHPTGGQLPAGEIARVKVRLLETFPDSEATGTALVHRDSTNSAAQLGDCLWLPWLEITAPTAGSSLPNDAPSTVGFRLTPGEHPIASLALKLEGGTVLAAPDSSDRNFLWQPNLSAGGLLDLAVTATNDQNHESTSAAVEVLINTPPVLAVIGDRPVDELAPLTFTASATDGDLPANTLIYSLIDAPAGATIDPVTGAFAWTPTEAQGPGSFTFSVRASDGSLHSDQSLTVTVNEVNIAPVLAAIGNQAVNELATLTFTATATDADLPANTLTYSLTGAPTGAGINASTGAFSWTPTEGQGPGSFTFTVRASDGALDSDRSLTVTVNEVNVAPVLAAITNKTGNEMAPLTFTAAATDTDQPANTLTYSLIGAPTGAGINANTGAFSWTPTEAQGPGSFTFTVRASDGALNSDRSLTVTVNEVNVAPVLAAITDKTVNELSPLTFAAATTDADVPANTLMYSLINAPTGAEINANTGVFSWTPTEAQGPGSFTFTVRASDGALNSDRSLTVTVNEVNVAPVLTAITDKTVNELVPLTFTASATDADLPANILTYSLIGAPTGAGINASTGAFSWTPSEVQGPGLFTFTVRASDGALNSDRSLTVTVNEVNLAPVLAGITDKTVNELSPLTFTASATDADLPANTLTYSLIGAPSGAGINATTGAFSWTPTEAQGPGSFTFTVRASDGALNSDSTLTVVVNEVNVAPVLAAINNKTVNELSPLFFTAAATDADLPANTLTYSLIGAPPGAGIDPITGGFSWTPTEAQGPGSYSLTVRVSDGNLTDEELIAVTVSDITPPVLTLPPNLVAEATGPAGAMVNFTVSALDRVDGVVNAIATPASGSTFPLGVTTVNVTSTDAAGNTRNGSFTVTVRDTTAPILTMPSNPIVTVNGTMGSVVNFTVSALDLVDGNVTATATPPSGGIFPTGTTTVNVSATDAAGNTAHGSFAVTVVNTAALLTNVQITPAGATTQAAISGEIRGGPPGGSVILQASSDLGKADAWEDIGMIQLDAGGNVVFSPVQDPHSAALKADFFRVKLP